MKPYDVSCPYCKQPPGEPCKVLTVGCNGPKFRKPAHEVRVNKSNKQQERKRK